MIEIVKNTLKQFDHDLKNKLGKNYLDIILYGSVVLNDFIPHRGDIDFIVILEENLPETNIDDIFEMHDIYRSGCYDNLEYQLEGAYYPKKILKNIYEEFVGCYIGTGRKGWKKLIKFQNNYFDLIEIKTSGIFFNNGVYEIYEPKDHEIKKLINEETVMYKELLQNNKIPLHCVIQYASRTIYYIETKTIGSKSESCKRYSLKNGNNKIIEKCGTIKFPDNYKNFENEHPQLYQIAEKSLNDLVELVNNQ